MGVDSEIVFFFTYLYSPFDSQRGITLRWLDWIFSIVTPSNFKYNSQRQNIIQEIDMHALAWNRPKFRVRCILSRSELPWQRNDEEFDFEKI